MDSIKTAFIGIGLLATLPASAAGTDITTTFQARIVIVNACTAQSASTLDFGNSQGVLASNVDQTSTINVTCTTDAPYTVKLDAGSHAGTPGDVNTRRMTDGTHFVSYNLYSDTQGGLVWDNTTGTSHTGSGTQDSLTVYGRVPAQTTPTAGTYTDTVTVTFTY